MKKTVLVASVLVLLLITIIAYLSNVFAWSNGGYSDDPSNPDYGTHDWVVEHALEWLPEEEKRYIVDNLAACLYGTELPDNGIAPNGIGDTAKHHIYYWSNGSLQDDASAVRAAEEYNNTLTFLNSGQTANASKTAGIMSHYIVDMAVFGHVMGSGTDWETENHHSDYETYVNQRTNSYDDEFNTYLSFDGKLTILSAYDAAIGLAYDTTFDVIGDLNCTWMDQNYNWSDPMFKDRCGESLNLAVNYLTDVLHTLYLEVDLPVHNIDSGRNFSTIQEAINDNETLDGHTIFVDAGTYYEHVVVNKTISMIGENTTTTIVDGGGIGNVTEVKVDNVAIEGFTIKDSGTSWPNGGITLGNVKNCFISGNILTGNRRGIGLFGASNNSVSGNILTNNLEGIVLSESSNNSISGNKITGSLFGISHWGSFNNEILRNNIKNNENGIELWFSSKNVIQENNITENTKGGIQLVMSFNNTLRGNRIADSSSNFYVVGNLTELVNDVETSNTVDGKPIYYWVNERDRAVPSDAGCVALVNCTKITVENLTLKNNWAGVLLAYTTNSTITKNNITNNESGISVDFSFSNTICGNNIKNNGGSGILLSDSSNNTFSGNNIKNNSFVVGLCEASDNKFYHNNFIENMGSIVVPIGDYEPSRNVWDDGYPSGGNYWSDYNGTDNDLDGIGDTSYFIDENNADLYPLMHPWSSLQVHNINTGLGYLTIQEAIDAPETLEGHTIFVEEGLYSEHVVVNKTISLVGEDRETTIIDGGEMITPIVHITANNVTVRAFTIRNGGRIFGWEGGGIYITNSNRNSIVENTILNTQYGINLRNSTKNTIIGNTMIENDVGIQFLDEYSSDSTIYHNNFTDNGWQVNSFAPSNNTWDNGYPTGGNYWSDYEERYPNATEIDNSGIWNTPYVIDENNQDNYPLIPEFPVWTPMLLTLIVLTLAIAIYKRRPDKTPIH